MTALLLQEDKLLACMLARMVMYLLTSLLLKVEMLLAKMKQEMATILLL
jgi:hypothetical protein